MELLRTWLKCVVCAALVAGLAQGIAPQGLPRRIVRFSGGLLLLIAILSPVKTLNGLDLAEIIEERIGQSRDYAETFSGQMESRTKSIIEEETAAYISDKAEVLGVDAVWVEVNARMTEDGFAAPERITVRGQGSDRAWEALRSAVEADFGLKDGTLEMERTEGP